MTADTTAIDLDTVRARLSADALEAAFVRCAILPVDQDELRTARAAFVADDARVQAASEIVADVRGAMGLLDPTWTANWDTRFDPRGPDAAAVDRYFFVFSLFAALDDVLAYHRSLGIPDKQSSAVLGDLGRHLRVFRRTFDIGGLHVQWWFRGHFTGLLYDFGRLQFNRGRYTVDPADARAADSPIEAGDFCLHCHIPESGPLLPAEVAASFARAQEFFARYYPDEPYTTAMCSSWLLDDQLADYLPADSNMVRFLRLWHLVGAPSPGDGAVLDFVFRMPGASVGDLPRRTTLERAVVAHLTADKHWHSRAGWASLAAAAASAPSAPSADDGSGGV